MVVLEMEWEYQRKKERYKVSDEFWDKLVEKVEVAEKCNILPIDPNRMVLHNTIEMIDFFKENCDNAKLVEKFSKQDVVLGTVIDKLVLVERIFISNGYIAPIHSIDGSYAYLYKKGKDWYTYDNKGWSFDETYKVKMSDRAMTRLPLIAENMVPAREKLSGDYIRHDKRKIAFAYVNVIAETNQFIIQHLFKDIFECRNWYDELIPTERLYKELENE